VSPRVKYDPNQPRDDQGQWTSGWSATMPEADARAFVAGTAFEGSTMHHFTSERGAAGIRSEGARMNEGIFGVGFYTYKDALPSDSMIGRTHKLDVVIRSEKPFAVRSIPDMERKLQAAGVDTNPRGRRLDVTAELTKLGYDSVLVENRLGPHYVMAFRREQIVVIDR